MKLSTVAAGTALLNTAIGSVEARAGQTNYSNVIELQQEEGFHDQTLNLSELEGSSGKRSKTTSSSSSDNETFMGSSISMMSRDSHQHQHHGGRHPVGEEVVVEVNPDVDGEVVMVEAVVMVMAINPNNRIIERREKSAPWAGRECNERRFIVKRTIVQTQTIFPPTFETTLPTRFDSVPHKHKDSSLLEIGQPDYLKLCRLQGWGYLFAILKTQLDIYALQTAVPKVDKS
eukprot:scaffold3092_cov153-Skeletonema_marinoi.AAC.16